MVIQHKRCGNQLQRVGAELLSGNHVIALVDTVRIRAAILCCQGQGIHAQGIIAVPDNLIEQPECTFPFPALQQTKICLPCLRHLPIEPGVLHCPGLFAESGNILPPVIHLVVCFVAAWIPPYYLVIAEKLHMVKKDLGLYRSPARAGLRPYLLVSITTKPLLFTERAS